MEIVPPTATPESPTPSSCPRSPQLMPTSSASRSSGSDDAARPSAQPGAAAGAGTDRDSKVASPSAANDRQLQETAAASLSLTTGSRPHAALVSAKTAAGGRHSPSAAAPVLSQTPSSGGEAPAGPSRLGWSFPGSETAFAPWPPRSQPSMLPLLSAAVAASQPPASLPQMPLLPPNCSPAAPAAATNAAPQLHRPRASYSRPPLSAPSPQQLQQQLHQQLKQQQQHNQNQQQAALQLQLPVPMIDEPEGSQDSLEPQRNPGLATAARRPPAGASSSEQAALLAIAESEAAAMQQGEAHPGRTKRPRKGSARAGRSVAPATGPPADAESSQPFVGPPPVRGARLVWLGREDGPYMDTASAIENTQFQPLDVPGGPAPDARKACPRCREVKPVSEFHRKYADDPNSTQTYCRKCHGDMKREKGAVRAPMVEEKACPNCGEVKRAALFYPNTIAPDGLSDKCRSCCKSLASEIRRQSMAQDAAARESPAAAAPLEPRRSSFLPHGILPGVGVVSSAAGDAAASGGWAWMPPGASDPGRIAGGRDGSKLRRGHASDSVVPYSSLMPSEQQAQPFSMPALLRRGAASEALQPSGLGMPPAGLRRGTASEGGFSTGRGATRPRGSRSGGRRARGTPSPGNSGGGAAEPAGEAPMDVSRASPPALLAVAAAAQAAGISPAPPSQQQLQAQAAQQQQRQQQQQQQQQQREQQDIMAALQAAAQQQQQQSAAAAQQQQQQPFGMPQHQQPQQGLTVAELAAAAGTTANARTVLSLAAAEAVRAQTAAVVRAAEELAAQARQHAMRAVAHSSTQQQALEWELAQQLLPPPPLTPELVQQWRVLLESHPAMAQVLAVLNPNMLSLVGPNSTMPSASPPGQ